MRKEEYTLHGRDWKRVNKRVARKAFNNGERLLIAGVDANLKSPWIMCSTLSNKIGLTFEQTCNRVAFYDCPELGRYLKYFIST